MANIALDEANALQKRIDALREQVEQPAPKSKLWKEYEEIQKELEAVRVKVGQLHSKANEEQCELNQTFNEKCNALYNEISVLTVARDALLAQARVN